MNTNIPPYYDDFDPTKNYYQVLFKSGLPIQARELNNLQSILQNQIKSFADVNYKNGSLVSGGEISYDKNVDVCTLQPLFNETPVNLSSLIGKTIVSNTTKISAVVLHTISASESTIGVPTIYLKYVSSGVIVNGLQFNEFADNETLTYNNIPFAKTALADATIYQSSIVNVRSAIFYWGGYFVNLNPTRILLDQYSNTPSYRIGLTFSTDFITTNEDRTLTDNAGGFNNCAAVGADRLKISGTVVKLPYFADIPQNFVELVKIKNGVVEYKIDTTIGNQIVDAIALRTYEQSGNYTLNDFQLDATPTLNNLFNNGTYGVGEVVDGITIINNTPLLNETNKIDGREFISVELSPGKAVVLGYNYNYPNKQIKNIPLSRTTDTKKDHQLFVDCGSYFEIKDLTGVLDLSSTFRTIQLYNKPHTDPSKLLIGSAKAINVSYQNDENRIYLIDTTTHTNITVSGSNANLVYGDYVEGVVSGASGYVYSYAGNTLVLENNTGTFIKNETLTNSRNTTILTVTNIVDYKIDSIKSLSSTTGFLANVVQDEVLVKGSSFNVSGNTITGTNSLFLEEFVIGNTIKIGNFAGTILTIPNNNTITTDYVFINQAISSLYKNIAILKSNNKNLYVTLPDPAVKSTNNRILSVQKNTGITLINGAGSIPLQNNNEIASGEVLVQTSTSSYIADFINVNTIQLRGSTYSGVANVTYNVEKLTPTNTINTLVNNKFIRYTTSKNDVIYTPFGTRYNDTELSLGVSDASEVLAVRYSNTDKNSPNYTTECFDSVTISNSSTFAINDIIYNDAVKARIIQISGNILYVLYNTSTHFKIGEVIKNWNKSITSTVVSVNPGSYTDITDNYRLVENKTNAISDISKLKIIDRNKIPLSDVVVVFSYYNTNIGDLTCVDSYSSYNKSTSNIIDFRMYAKSPIINGFGTLLSPYLLSDSGLNTSVREIKFKSFPTPRSIFKCNYEYYLSRTDLAIIDSTGKYDIISGNPGLLSTTPTIPTDSLAIASIELKPYDTENLNIFTFSNKRYTMQDIGNIETRLEYTESTIALTQLETKANNTVLVDNNGTVRLKTGFIVDEFSNLDISNTSNRLYKSHIDLVNKELVPISVDRNVDLIINPADSVNQYKIGKSIISLPYNENKFVEQNKHTKKISVNQFNLINWEGLLSTTPTSDNWVTSEQNFVHDSWLPNSTKQIPQQIQKLLAKYNKTSYLSQQTILINVKAVKPNTKLSAYINSIDVTNLVIPSLCKVIKDGTKGTNNISFIVGEDLVWQNVNARTVDGSKYQPNSISKYTGAKVKALSNQSYTSTTNLLNIDWEQGYRYELEDIKSGSYVFGVTSGAIAIIDNTDIISDSNGNFVGNLFIPNPNKTNYKFPAGQIVIKFVGNNTFADTKFYCGGDTIIDNQYVTSLRLPENNDSTIIPEQITFTNITKSNDWFNPLSQLFKVDQIGGCFMTGLHLFFAAKDNSIPIIVQIRTVQNGYPTEIVLPFSEISIDPNNISISNDGTASTKISFDDIVYLKENVQYALCIISNSNQYQLYAGSIGDRDANNLVVERNPNVGFLYTPQNTTIGIVDQTTILKFDILKATFSNSGNVTFNNEVLLPTVDNTYITTTKNSNLLKIHAPNHGLHTTNNKVTISDVKSEMNPTILTNTISDSQYTVNTDIAVETPELIPTLINNLPISITNPGYLKIDNEIIRYIAVNNATKLVTVPIGGRGQDNTQILQHLNNSVVEVYSLYGIPLVEVNKSFTSIVPIDLDNFGVYTINNANITNVKNGVNCTTNHQFEKLTPNISYQYYPNTNISATLSATTSTSISSTNTLEPSFLPETYNLSLSDANIFNKPLMVASIDNQIDPLSVVVNMSTSNNNLSPIIDYDKCSVVVSSNRINNSVGDELLPNISDSEFVYITSPISLILPSQAIVVIFDGVRKANHNIEAYVKVAKEDNLPEFDKNNFIKIPSKIYPVNQNYTEFRFELRDLPQFKEFQIKLVGKSDTQTNFPKIKNLRIITTAS